MKATRPEGTSTHSTEAIVFTAVLFVFTLVLLAASFPLVGSSGLVPRVVGIPLALLLCYRLIRETADRRRSQDARPVEELAQKSGELSAILWLLALPAVSTILGFVAGPALYVFGWARFRAGERIAVAVAAGALTALAILALFAGLLGAALPMGLLGVLV